MHKYVYFILIFFIAQLFYSQCPIGDVYLNSQTDVQNYIANFGTCEVITGNLYISDATDISGITSIKRIEGSLRISYSKINSVSNFGNLEYVGGDFIIDQSHLIETIDGINNLQTVNGNFSITDNYGGLKRINGFDALQTVGGNFEISGNSLMETIDVFQNLTIVDGWFSILRNNSLIKIDGFNGLIRIGTVFDISSFKGNLSIENNVTLTEINGFNSLMEVVRNIDIGQNASLEKIIGFTRLEKVTYNMNFDRCPLLIEIPLFNSLVTIGSGLTIWSTGLIEINSFNNIQIIGDLYPSWGNLIINSNDNLLEITGFTKLVELRGGLDIILNNKLINLQGFISLTKLRSLGIGANNSLTSLSGLENIFVIDGKGSTAISIGGNPSLIDCSVLCNLLTNGTIIGYIYINDNPSKCSSEYEVREECIPDFDKDGVLNDDDLDDDNDGILDTVEQNGNPNRDTDGDNYPDYQDLDSDGDGCFDVIEAGFIDGDGNGTLGSLPDTVDANGLIIGEPDGYTIPLDSNSDSIFDFQQANTLSAGEDGDFKICINNSPVDLFGSLNGTPDTGGVWSPSLSSGTGMFNPSIDAPGIYTYTVTNGVCGSDTSEVNVTIDVLPNAGENGDLEICINSSPVDLFGSLNGTPDTGGVWSPSLSSGTGIFNPSIDAAGVYTYTVTNGVCGSDTSEVNVTIDVLPNAGENGDLEICINSSPVDLFGSLNGTPDTGGVWSPSLSSGTGMFNPSIDAAGVYTYTVTNGVCGSDTSELSITITNVTPIKDYEIKTTEISGNNSIEIIFNSNLQYEYSLDNVIFQSSNMFTNLSGGDYTIYVNEVNGCGVLEVLVSILDYPKYFTPNNDGINDTWKLKGRTNQNYSIYIYDRYGKLLKHLVSFENSWDGTFNGKVLPTSDYWFKVVFDNGVVKNGHFTLKR